ncbi:hypothetical protein [Aeromonas caviae]|uniref:hypothetical protein n=1 Tax=Aeromonas caviae TaxID=648 RepID=UPI002B45EFE8|nr:hypothetical protein [Aeromonas caviae]
MNGASSSCGERDSPIQRTDGWAIPSFLGWTYHYEFDKQLADGTGGHYDYGIELQLVGCIEHGVELDLETHLGSFLAKQTAQVQHHQQEFKPLADG